jgi:natural resistance-associated macrophage protein
MNIKWAKWKRVLLTRSIAMVPTIIVALIATNDLDMMNNWLNVLQSVQLPFALLPILHFTSSETIMKEFKNGR